MKTLLTLLLIVSLITFVGDTPAQAKPEVTLLEACCVLVVVLAVGSVFVVGLVKMCKNIPKLPPPPATNNVPTSGTYTNVTLAPLILETTNTTFGLQTSTGNGWQDSVQISVDSMTATDLTYTATYNGQTISGGRVSIGANGRAELPLVQVPDQSAASARFFRLVSTP